MSIKKTLGRLLPDALFLRVQFYRTMGKILSLKNPKTFNEKLQWLKLYDRRSEYNTLVDKYKVRDHVAGLIGKEYLIPLLGVWDYPKEIDFEELPDQFVLKCTHNSGIGLCVCKDKSKLDIQAVRKELERGLKQDYYWLGREWPYKDVPRKIIAEKYMIDESGVELKDYKINCFSGKPVFIQVMSGRNKEMYYLDHYDPNWQPMDIRRKDKENNPQPVSKPKHLQEMLEIAEILSKNLPFARIDLYLAEDKVYFGEITLYPRSGFIPFEDPRTDLELGKLIHLTTSQG